MKVGFDIAFKSAKELNLTQPYGKLCEAGLKNISVEHEATRVVVDVAGKKLVVARGGHKDWRVKKNEIAVTGVTSDNLKAWATKIGQNVRHEERTLHHKVGKHAPEAKHKEKQEPAKKA